MDSKKSLGLYIHVPFCRQRCLYCDFCSTAGADRALIEKYVDSLVRCIEDNAERASGYEVDTVYIGGGTPTVLPIEQFERLTAACFRHYSIANDAEISCECNPATASRGYFSDMLKMGINRLSIGLQSMQNDELAALGRIHDKDGFLSTFFDARLAGFENISVDLMYGIPRQTAKSFEDTLVKTVELAPEHISAYCLKVEENTPFGKMGEALALPDEDETCDMYEACVSLLRGAGYDRYEISNFAKKGRESRHNLRYWLGSEYLGLGAAAHSYFGGERYAYSPNIAAFANGEFETCEREKIEDRERMREHVMLGLRLERGISASDFSKRFGVEFTDAFPDAKRFIESGYIVWRDGRYAFSDKGFFVSSYILSEILDFS